jgi:hypothetical protein
MSKVPLIDRSRRHKVNPSFSITRMEAALPASTLATIRRRRSSLKPKSKKARAASVARPRPQ